MLGTAITVMLPASISGGETIKTSDWIGFAGSVVASAITLIAATLAWFAVQRQIDAQNAIAERQAALTEFETLHRLSVFIGKEIRLIRRFRTLASKSTRAEEIYFKSRVTLNGVTKMLALYETLDRQLKRALKRHLDADAGIRVFVDVEPRNAVYHKGVDLRYLGVRKVVETLRDVESRNKQTGAVSEEDRVACQNIKLEPMIEDLRSAVRAYLLFLEARRDDLIPQIKDAQRRAAL